MTVKLNIFFALCLPGLLGTLVSCQELNERPRMSLASGEQAYRNGQYGAAIQHLTSYLAGAERGPERARALYVRGMALALTQRREQARADLLRAARGAAGTDLAWQPYAVIGILHFEDENWVAGARALKTATKLMPAVAPLDALLFRLGLCHERSGLWSAAATPYRHIVSQFPQGPYTRAADRRLQLRANHFAVQCGVFSSAENARRLVADLEDRGLATYVRQEQRDGARKYVVFEGYYESFGPAKRALARVRGYVRDAVLWP